MVESIGNTNPNEELESFVRELQNELESITGSRWVFDRISYVEPNPYTITNENLGISVQFWYNIKSENNLPEKQKILNELTVFILIEEHLVVKKKVFEKDYLYPIDFNQVRSDIINKVREIVSQTNVSNLSKKKVKAMKGKIDAKKLVKLMKEVRDIKRKAVKLSKSQNNKVNLMGNGSEKFYCGRTQEWIYIYEYEPGKYAFNTNTVDDFDTSIEKEKGFSSMLEAMQAAKDYCGEAGMSKLSVYNRKVNLQLGDRNIVRIIGEILDEMEKVEGFVANNSDSNALKGMAKDVLQTLGALYTEAKEGRLILKEKAEESRNKVGLIVSQEADKLIDKAQVVFYTGDGNTVLASKEFDKSTTNTPLSDAENWFFDAGSDIMSFPGNWPVIVDIKAWTPDGTLLGFVDKLNNYQEFLTRNQVFTVIEDQLRQRGLMSKNIRSRRLRNSRLRNRRRVRLQTSNLLDKVYDRVWDELYARFGSAVSDGVVDEGDGYISLTFFVNGDDYRLYIEEYPDGTVGVKLEKNGMSLGPYIEVNDENEIDKAVNMFSNMFLSKAISNQKFSRRRVRLAREEYINPDGSFKRMTCPDNPDEESKFCGCVRYMMSEDGGNKSLESAKKICGYIRSKVKGR